MRRTLSRIQPLHGPVVPSPRWEQAGRVPETGEQLYTESIPRSRAVPDYEQVECKQCFGERQKEPCEECNGTGTVDGEQRWKVNPLNGERLHKINKAEFYTQHRMFFIESDGQGNQLKVDWSPPTPEQIEALRHEKAVADMMPKLASALVDSGLDTDEIVKRLTSTPSAPESVPTPAPEKAADIVPAVDPDASEEL